MSEWTDDELKEFDQITSDLSSLHQMERISARLAVNAFVKKHGKAKCDAMFEELKRRETA